MRNPGVVLFTCCLSVMASHAASDTNLLPYPQQYNKTEGAFSLKEIRFSAERDVKPLFTDWLQELPSTHISTEGKPIVVYFVDSIAGVPVNQPEAYHLRVTSQEISIEAVTEQGTYWAIQTLRQLTEKRGNNAIVSGCEITDWPAFRIRGFMHDVGRSYLPVEELKREIAMLSRYKINTFHWHLTDDHAWRLESSLFPMLNDSVNTTRLPGKFYTHEEAKELVAFCKQHHVLLIPEIEMPGHSAVFSRTFHYDMQSVEGMNTLKLLMDEVCDVFVDVPYIHIGTDEVSFTNPRFVPDMVSYIREKGKKVISWNPGWNYKAGEIDLLQMWSYRGQPHQDIPVIDSRLHYINHYDTFADIVALHNSNIAGQQQGSPDYAGSILAVWNDRVVVPEENIILENPFYPAMLTLAERAWRGGQESYFYTKGSLIDPEGSDGYNLFAAFEARLLWHKEHYFKGYPFAYVKQTNVRWRITDPFPNEGNLTRSFPPEEQLAVEYTYEGRIYNTQPAIGAGIYLRHVWGNTVPSFFPEPKPDHTAYAWTWVYSPKAQQVGLMACTQNYGRSEKDLPPPQGKWDYRESCMWVNDTAIQPPVWTAVHTELSDEIPLGNENAENRPPIAVLLQKGWNKVLLKLPIGAFSTPQVRLQKWMFTFVFVTLDGERAVDGLVYSPEKER